MASASGVSKARTASAEPARSDCRAMPAAVRVSSNCKRCLTVGMAAGAMLNERKPRPTSKPTSTGSDAISPQSDKGHFARLAATADLLAAATPPTVLLAELAAVTCRAQMNLARYAEAEEVYREDLKKLPDNGWSLYGLAESLRLQDKNADEAKATKAKFQKLWAKADTRITSSCLCQPGQVAKE